MHVHDIRVERRPVDGRVRLLAEVEYGSGEADAETYWIDVPGAVADDVSTTASPWAALLVPLALRGDGTLRLDAPVDRELAVGLQEWADVWRSWDRALAPLRLEAELCDAGAPRGSRTAAFFSGGVDSWYTVLAARRDDARHDASRAARRPPLRDLLCVWGFDILLDNEPAFARLRARYAPEAEQLGLTLLDVATNVRHTRWGARLGWEQHANGAALAAVALALEPRLHTVLVASGNGTSDLSPSGSHTVTDPLLSSARTRIVHHGATQRRVDKYVLIADHPAVQRSLHVCWRGFDDQNCGRCHKCLRTMAALAAVGALPRFSTFPTTTLDLRRLERVVSHATYERRGLEDVAELARAHGREDVAAAATASLRRSRRVARALRVLSRMRRTRFVWRWADVLERRLLREE